MITLELNQAVAAILEEHGHFTTIKNRTIIIQTRLPARPYDQRVVYHVNTASCDDHVHIGDPSGALLHTFKLDDPGVWKAISVFLNTYPYADNEWSYKHDYRLELGDMSRTHYKYR